jgi:type I restriction enzyme, S subunit
LRTELFHRLLADPGVGPSGSRRVRAFVLDLAIRGRLTTVERQDTSAEFLWNGIQQQRAALGNRPAPLRQLTGPFEIPDSWIWVHLGELLLKLTDGTHHSPPTAPDGDYLYITAKNVKEPGVSLDDVSYVTKEVHDEIFSRCDPAKGDVLYIKDGATTGVATVNDLEQPFSLLSSVALLKVPDGVDSRLLVTFLRSPYFYQQMRASMKGSALPRVTLKRMAPALLPLPPTEEQHRIVRRVDQLMGLCDELEAVQRQRDETTDRLRAASLARLTARTETPGKADQKDAAFFLSRPGRMVTKHEHVADLRRAIRDLAVQGCLGGSVAEWESSTVGQMCEFITSGSRGWAQYYSPTGPTFLRAQNVRFGRLRIDELAHVRPPEGREGSRTRVSINDLVVVITGAGVTNPALVDIDLGEAYVSQHLGLLRLRNPEAARWLLLWLMAERGARASLTDRAYGSGKPGLNLDNLRTLHIALPPAPDQRRIIARVGELMILCDELEVALKSAEEGRAKLLEAVLHEALNGRGVGAEWEEATA